MLKRKIPVINDEFDLSLLIHIFKKNIIVISILFAIAGFTDFLILRYTHPIFGASSVIQLSSENKSESRTEIKKVC